MFKVGELKTSLSFLRNEDVSWKSRQFCKMEIGWYVEWVFFFVLRTFCKQILEWKTFREGDVGDLFFFLYSRLEVERVSFSRDWCEENEVVRGKLFLS